MCSQEQGMDCHRGSMLTMGEPCANQNAWFSWRKDPCERMYTRTCPACMQQTVPDLTSIRVYQSPGGAGAHLSGLNKLFFGYSILGESVLGAVLPRPQNRPGAFGQAQTWIAGPSNSVVQGALEFDIIGHLLLVFWCAKKEPPDHFRSPVRGVSVKCTTIQHSLSITDEY